ncbi:MAG: hypothetical protein Q4B80_01695 [Aerococcaceae bacterium]|nr:hypothetical protein [Aerococcaceae bacterium]
MTKKYYDEFSRLTVEKMAQSISEMTYAHNQTQVPTSHYKKLLQANVIELLAQDNVVQSLLLNAILSQLHALQKESPELFFKALVCFDMGVKSDKINQQVLDNLERAWQVHKSTKQLLTDSIRATYETRIIPK